jgi:hypothetical protein
MIGASELNDVALKDGELMLDPDVDGIDASLMLSTNKGLVDIFTIYYWLRNNLNTCKKLTIKDRSKQQLILLLLSGIEPNPGPRRPRFPCTIRQKACKTDSIACDH